MRKTLYIMVGISGAGKSEFAKTHLIKGARWHYVSRDEIRFSKLQENETYFEHEDEVFQTYIDKIVWGLKHDDIFYVIADATHTSWSSRNKLINNLSKSGIRLKDIDIIPVVMKTDLAECIRRNANREGLAQVPNKVIERMYHQFTDPASDKFDYTAIMYVNNGMEYTEKPKFMYHKNDMRIKEIPIKEVIKR